MVKCSFCGNVHDNSEIDEDNIVCHQCGMPIGFMPSDDELDDEEVNDFFDDDEEEFVDPDALSDEDLAKLLEGVDIEDDLDFDDDEIEDGENEEEEDY